MADDSSIFQALLNQVQEPRKPVRDAWIFSSTYSLKKGIKPIQMTVNPNSASFSQTKRTSTGKKTIGGTTFFHWSDKNGRNLDPLVITFQGETGPISGLGPNDAVQKKTSIITVGGKTVGTRAYENGRNWARLYSLTTQPQIDPNTFEPTLWTIRYKSLLFPEVLFSGFFNNTLQFVDDAANPFSKKYSMAFTVTKDTSPSILELRNLIGDDDLNILSKSDTALVTGNPNVA